jgi:hypothetical protein
MIWHSRAAHGGTVRIRSPEGQDLRAGSSVCLWVFLQGFISHVEDVLHAGTDESE